MDTKTPLFDAAHCEPDSWESLDYEGKVLAMRPEVLKEEYRTGEFQLWLATGGFGCSPTAVPCTPPASRMERRPAGIAPTFLAW